MMRSRRLYPDDVFAARVPASMTDPSARTASNSITQSPTFPYFTVCLPAAFVAIIPPMVAMSPEVGRGGKKRPYRSSSSFTAAPRMPGCTSTCRSSGRTSRTASIRVMSRLMPPCVGTAFPSIPVAAANGVTGTPCSLAAARTAETSSVDSGQTTTSGSTASTSAVPQSREWWSRSADAVEYWSSRRSSVANRSGVSVDMGWREVVNGRQKRVGWPHESWSQTAL
jgi:hypothetical protein